jgi:hypothetical protein
MKFQYNVLFLLFIIVIVSAMNTLFSLEGFTNNVMRDLGQPDTTHSVDMPLTTRYSCKNFCGPTARCSITGQQCFADIDCPGCAPLNTEFIPGNDNAEKIGVTYSTLTTDIGTNATVITKPVTLNFGVNTWKTTFNDNMKLFNERYKPPSREYPKYPERTTLSGEFVDNGPLQSNADF